MMGWKRPIFLYIELNHMNIKIYTSTGCTWCSRTKELLSRANITDYNEILWSDLPQEEQEQFHIDYPDVQGFPVVFIDGEYIGGLVPLAKKFLADGLVTTSKK